MRLHARTWPRRFVRWLCRSPFQSMPPQYGNTVPPDLQRFAEQAEEAGRHGLGEVSSQAPSRNARVKPARLDEALERQ